MIGALDRGDWKGRPEVSPCQREALNSQVLAFRRPSMNWVALQAIGGRLRPPPNPHGPQSSAQHQLAPSSCRNPRLVPGGVITETE